MRRVKEIINVFVNCLSSVHFRGPKGIEFLKGFVFVLTIQTSIVRNYSHVAPNRGVSKDSLNVRLG